MESTDKKTIWQGIALSWPVNVGGIETSRPASAGFFDSAEAALAAAKDKMEEIGGVGFRAEPI